MPTPKKGPRLGGSPAHQRAILANLATSLFEHGAITTTEAKARVLRPYAERLITKAKRGDLHNRRQVMAVIRDKSVVHTLFTEIGPRFSERPGGYTRITKIGPRKGDNAPMAVIALVVEEYTARARSAAPAASGSRGRTATTSDQSTDTTENDAAAPDDTAPDTTDDTTDDTAPDTTDDTAPDTADATETAADSAESSESSAGEVATGADEELAAQTEEQEAVAGQEPEGDVPADTDTTDGDDSTR